ncbi:hypothetical protein I2492_09965 [Budviciaceae bacterium CWB-B4]|uniref:Uncharacterized protein n=1 Tax=Limnobaculum xujianqingii TaxID=2738837 RepID=A0A9D7AIG7_9GAMM|nr:hypothetical protein [Limnobaculum xujianqingii]MBK5073621.1 hypothetical protein [Limnobaculum xujianqingii]MBK5176648.1 hypothetical protein [Limnobaculum xujianqingii]
MTDSSIKPINNIYFWILLASNPLLLLWENHIDTYFSENFTLILTLCAQGVMIFLDREEIVKAGYDKKPSRIWIIFFPVYIWQRVSLFHRNYRPLCILYFLIYIVLIMFSYKQDIADTSCKVTTDIIKEQFNSDTKCLKVVLGEEITKNHYKGIAQLSNGKSLNIIVEERKDMIYVTIPYQ